MRDVIGTPTWLPSIHEAVGVAVVAVFATGWIWGLVGWISKRGAGEKFWVWLTVAQIVAGVQAVIGITLLLFGLRPESWLHYVYGFGPFVVLTAAHQIARDQQRNAGLQAWVVFALAAFICFGLTTRALMTGLGG